MSTVQMLMAQKMALERRIEQAHQDELERQRRLEAERLAAQQVTARMLFVKGRGNAL